jgi:FkbM family methyltransferase
MAVDSIASHTFLPRFIDSSSTVVDFGASQGEFSHGILSKYGCRVFAAEPAPDLYAAIPRHPKLTLLPVAITGKNGSINLNIFEGRCASILGKIDAAEQSRLVVVETVTLCEFKRRAGVSHIDLVKIDIEGAELEVLETASDEDLVGIDQVTIEFHDYMFPEHREPVRQAKQKLASLGFWVVPLSLDNSDVLCVNRRLGVTAAEILWLRTAIKYSRGIVRRSRRMFANR